MPWPYGLLIGAVGLFLLYRIRVRWRLSMAKSRSLAGHPRIALRLSRWIRGFSYDESEIFSVDGAPEHVAERRRGAFEALSDRLRTRSPKTVAQSQELESQVSDVAFTSRYRVPFPFRNHVREHLPLTGIVDRSEGARLRDLDGEWSYDLTGAYGVNLFGVDFYKECMARGVQKAQELGLVLGPYHPSIVDNVRRLRQISGLDEVSFHMSGTEAVMQAVRLARFHTGRSHAVRFSGAYHGWSGGVQVGPGNPRPSHEIYTLEEMSPQTLRVLRTRKDIACVLVNALQAMNPNGVPSSDSTLLASDRGCNYDKEAYRLWLKELREVCTERGIVLIFDEVFLGFRLAIGGVQEFFGVQADMVTYGKTLGGGLPVGVVCGKHAFMRRYQEERPADVCFARGTFNSHPYVMTTMNEFLLALERPEIRSTYDGLEERWDSRRRRLNDALREAECPVKMEGMVSVWTTLYTEPCAYNWMLQYYMAAEGLILPWIGTGRFIFSHDLSDEDFAAICDRFVRAARTMKEDGWWWPSPNVTNKGLKKSVMRRAFRSTLGRRIA